MIAPDDITLREEELATILESPAPPASVTAAVDPNESFQLTNFMGNPVLRPFPTAGGEADIYLIERNGAPTVLKLYRFGLAPREELLQRIVELGRTFPDCFVPVLEYGYDPATRRWYELMEYISGGSLKDLIEPGIGVKLVPLLLPQLAKALSVLHEQHILHLDLKPSNILIRSKDPLKVVLADFGISSLLDPELSRKMTTVKGTPHYWSPESFTGVVGEEADYWSLGIMLLEMLHGRHPFVGMDPKMIMFTLSTRGVELDENLPEPYRTLLMGLLTRQPGMRWGKEQLLRFLAGESGIPVYYNRAIGNALEGTAPFRIMGKEYREIGDLLSVPLTGEDGWNSLRMAVEDRSLQRWLADNGNQDASQLMMKFQRESGEDHDLALVRLIYHFRPELPFILYGRQISLHNLHLFALRTVSNEASLTEIAILDDLMKGRLAVYYGEFLFLTNKQPDQLYKTLKALGDMCDSKRFDYYKSMEPTDTLKILDLLMHPERWFLPASIRVNPEDAVEFLVSNHELLLTIEDVEHYQSKHLVPKDLQEALKAVSQKDAEYFRKCSTFMYRAVNERLLPERREYENLLKTRLIPPELSEAINGSRHAPAAAAWKSVCSLQSQNLLLEESETLSWLAENSRDSTIQLRQHILLHGDGGSPLTTAEYSDLAITIKRRVIPSLLPVVAKLARTLRDEALSDRFQSCGDIARYVEALESRKIAWDESDRRAVKKLYELVYLKKVPVPELLGQVNPPHPGGIVHLAMETLLGVTIFEDSPELQWIKRGAVAGILMGGCFALSLMLLNQQFPLLFLLISITISYLRGSKVIGVVVFVTSMFILESSASNRTLFSDLMVTALNIALMAWIGILIGGRIGARMGKRFEKLTDGERFLADYEARIADVVDAESVKEALNA